MRQRAEASRGKRKKLIRVRSSRWGRWRCWFCYSWEVASESLRPAEALPVCEPLRRGRARLLPSGQSARQTFRRVEEGRLSNPEAHVFIFEGDVRSRGRHPEGQHV